MKVDIMSRSEHTAPERKANISAFLKNESGATAIEYGLIATGIFFAIIAGVYSVGPAINGMFTNAANGFK